VAFCSLMCDIALSSPGGEGLHKHDVLYARLT